MSFDGNKICRWWCMFFVVVFDRCSGLWYTEIILGEPILSLDLPGVSRGTNRIKINIQSKTRSYHDPSPPLVVKN